MGTAIIRPQGCLRYNRYHAQTLEYPPPRPHRNPNSNQMRSRRRKRSPVSGDRGQVQSRMVEARSPVKNLVMGQVKILKRGEVLEALKLGFGDEDLVLSSTDRLGPDPDTVQKQISGLYAGSASFFASPPPSSLPIPAFFEKKEKRNDAATSDLRRLLRLDLI